MGGMTRGTRATIEPDCSLTSSPRRHRWAVVIPWMVPTSV